MLAPTPRRSGEHTCRTAVERLPGCAFQTLVCTRSVSIRSRHGTHAYTAAHLACSLEIALPSQTYETVDRVELDAFEQGCSLISVSFADDPNAYYAMGSAQVIADEPEPSKVQTVFRCFAHTQRQFGFLRRAHRAMVHTSPVWTRQCDPLCRGSTLMSAPDQPTCTCGSSTH